MFHKIWFHKISPRLLLFPTALLDAIQHNTEEYHVYQRCTNCRSSFFYFNSELQFSYGMISLISILFVLFYNFDKPNDLFENKNKVC